MTPTVADLHFWQARNLPAWIYKMRKVPQLRATVHECINERARAQGKFRPQYEMDAGNLLGILRMIRKREALLPSLERMAANPGCIIRPERRAAYCRKWAARIKS